MSVESWVLLDPNADCFHEEQGEPCPGGREVVLDPDRPPRAWAEWAQQGPLEWRYFIRALRGEMTQ